MAATGTFTEAHSMMAMPRRNRLYEMRTLC